MNVSANIIRFPDQPIAHTPIAERPAEPAGIVAFTPVLPEDGFNLQAQEHGQVFAAHRIVGRIADQLDSIATL